MTVRSASLDRHQKETAKLAGQFAQAVAGASSAADVTRALREVHGRFRSESLGQSLELSNGEIESRFVVFSRDILRCVLGEPGEETCVLNMACASGVKAPAIAYLVENGARGHTDSKTGKGILTAAAKAGNAGAIGALFSDRAVWRPSPDGSDAQHALEAALTRVFEERAGDKAFKEFEATLLALRKGGVDTSHPKNSDVLWRVLSQCTRAAVNNTLLDKHVRRIETAVAEAVQEGVCQPNMLERLGERLENTFSHRGF